MQPRRLSLLGVCLLCFACIGASCDGGKPPAQAGAAEVDGQNPGAADRSSDGPQVEDLPMVDTSELTDAEKAVWVGLINEQLSPCGDPVSVGSCAAGQAKCAGCVPAARYLTRLVMAGHERDTIVEHYTARFGATGKVEVPLGESPVRGAPMAPVTIVEFSDFQCPHCGRAHPQLSRALAELDGRVKLIFKHYPLSGHPRAVPAAMAAEAAREQGKFWEMHDLLFEHQDKLEDPHLLAYAEQLGLDIPKFKEAMASPSLKARIEADRDLGRRLGVASTPTIIINGRRFGEGSDALMPYLREEVEL
ncbi:MAG: thioredoxin domain-containing protein [Myxococcales bacterium]|nr:thioredoxin domain-containing protein [Myxococcales bacterium]